MPLVGGSSSSGAVNLGINADDVQFQQRIAAVQKSISGLESHTNAKLKSINAEAAKLNQQIARQQGWDDFKKGAVGAVATITVGLVALKKGYDATIGSTIQYANEVRKLSLVSGTTAEESSRLLQVLDDFKISSEQVTAATRKLTAEGLSPTTETLATLSDEYLSLNAGQEQAAFLMEHFGRAGQDFAEIMGKGGDAIRKMSDAVSEGLILNQKQLDDARKLEIAQDALNESWQQFTMTISSKGIPALTGIIDEFNNTARAIEIMKEQGLNPLVEMFTNSEGYINALQQAAQETNAHRDAMLASTDATNINADALNENALALAALSSANANIIQGAISATEANRDYQESQADIQAQIEELTAAKAAMYPWEKDKIQETQDKIDELSGKYSENAAEFAAAMEKKFALMAVEKIALSDGVAGYSEAEFAKAQAILQTTDIATAAVFEQQQAMENLTSAVADGAISTQDFTKILSGAMADGVVSIEEIQSAIDGVSFAGSADEMSENLKDPISDITTLNGKIEATAAKSGMEWDFFFNIHTTGRVPSLPSTGSGVTLNSGGGAQFEERYASGGYGLSNMPIGGIASVGEIGEEGIMQTQNGLYVIPSSKWRQMKGRGARAGRGFQRGSGQLSGEDLRNARIEQRQRRDDFGGGYTTSSIPTSISEATVTESGMTSAGAANASSSAGVGQMGAVSQQLFNSGQSVAELQQVNTNLRTLIEVTAGVPGDMARVAANQSSKYS